MKDKIYQNIASYLPQRLVYFCFYRLWATATTFEEGSGMTPNEMTWYKAVDLWERKYAKK